MPDSRPSILVIDPHPVVRRGIVAALHDSFHQADIAACPSFAEARSFLARHTADLVIAEWNVDGDCLPDWFGSLRATGFAAPCLLLTALDELPSGGQRVEVHPLDGPRRFFRRRSL